MPELSFRQHWLPEQEPHFQPGKVLLTREGEMLRVEARLTDRAIYAPEAKFNDFLYQFSDVFELFIKAEGDSIYHELHFSPTNVKLQLRFSENDTRPFDLEKSLLWEEDFSTSEVTRDAEGWTLRAEFSLSKLTSLRPIPTRWKVGCGRYDYQPNADTGETLRALSNTASITELDFHRHHEWETIELPAS